MNFSNRNWIERRPSMDRLVAKRVHQLRAAATRHEILVKDALDDCGIKYRFQKGFLCKGVAVRIVDFMLPEHRVFIEVDGNTHNSRKEKAADRIRESQILKSARKYKFIRIRNESVDEHFNDLPAYLMSRLLEKCRFSEREKVRTILHKFEGLSQIDREYREAMGQPMSAQCWQATCGEGAVKVAGVNDNTPLKADEKSQRYAEAVSDMQPSTGLVPFKDLASFVNA